MKKKTIIIILILASAVLLALVSGYLVWKNAYYTNKPSIYEAITSFKACEESGFPIMESFPEQCKLPNGTIFTNDNVQDNAPEKFTHFPVEVEDMVSPPNMYGLWPYGVKGSNSDSHNEGHPGWDFELTEGSKLFAVASGYVMQIHDGNKDTKVIEYNAVLASGNHHVTYHSVTNIPEYVKEGANIKAGQVIAEVGYPLGDGSFMFHFGAFPPGDSVGSCPTPFFSEESASDIELVVANSLNVKTGDPYESACVGKINREIWEKNFPDAIKNLGGNEQWE